MRGTIKPFQLLVSFVLSISGLTMAFKAGDMGAMLLGSLLGGMGLSFLALLATNLRKQV
jgi:hypothetical protein